MQQEQLTGIAKPHAHDVLSGRGNFVNHHVGNEHFRKLVKQHKETYVACPKDKKAIYSKIIYDEIRAMTPPGRFLKQDSKTKLWSDIGKKKALYKTRQALREGAPEIRKVMETGAGSGEAGGGGNNVSEDLRIQRMAESSGIGSFGLRPFPPGAANHMFNTGAMGNATIFSGMPAHVGMMNAMYQSQGATSILAAAAAHLQAQQMHRRQPQIPPNVQAEFETQLQLLKQATQVADLETAVQILKHQM
ncbi:hypothetical protein ACHAXR_007335 [Thalassiosira sp. AJA248-18]